MSFKVRIIRLDPVSVHIIVSVRRRCCLSVDKAPQLRLVGNPDAELQDQRHSTLDVSLTLYGYRPSRSIWVRGMLVASFLASPPPLHRRRPGPPIRSVAIVRPSGTTCHYSPRAVRTRTGGVKTLL